MLLSKAGIHTRSDQHGNHPAMRVYPAMRGPTTFRNVPWLPSDRLTAHMLTELLKPCSPFLTSPAPLPSPTFPMIHSETIDHAKTLGFLLGPGCQSQKKKIQNSWPRFGHLIPPGSVTFLPCCDHIPGKSTLLKEGRWGL